MAPEGLYLLTDQPAQEQAAYSSKGLGAMDTFLTEAAAVRQERRLSGQNHGEGAPEGPTGQTLRSQEGAQSGASG